MTGKSPGDLFPYSFREGQGEALEFLQSHFPEKNICLDAATGFGKTPIILSVLLMDEWPVLWTVRTGNETDRPVEELKAINEAADENFFGFSYRGKRDMCLLARDRSVDSYRGVSTLCGREKEDCEYYEKLNGRFHPGRLRGEPLLYSEIMEKCRKHGVCPYYTQQKLLGYADLVGLSYNYIVHEGIGWAIRNKLPFRLCHLVVDEAHNLRRAGNVNSDKVTLGTLRYAIGEMDEFDTTRGEEVGEFVEDMRSKAEKMHSRLKSGEEEDTFEPMEFLRGVGYEDPVSYLKSVRRYGKKIHRRQLKEEKSPRSSLHHLGNFWLDSLDYLDEKGVAFIGATKGDNLELERWDMRSAEILGDRWNDFRSVTFCSGTLKPIPAFAETIGLENWQGSSFEAGFGERSRALIVEGVSTKGDSLDDEQVEDQLGLLDSFLDLDANLAVFSASYRVQNRLLREGLEGLAGDKGREVFRERQGMSGDEGRKVLEGFKASDEGLLCATMTGRFAEGADFPGEELEGIYLAGIPFDRMTLRTRLYLDYYRDLYGEDKGRYYAYIVPAIRRASQALGRALRSKEDRALFVLADERYGKTQHFNLLPGFVQDRARTVAFPEAREAMREAWNSVNSEEGGETVLTTVKKALEEGKVIEIDYTSESSGPTTRKVDPYVVERGYMAGHCHLRDEVRCFKLSRVQRVEITEETFEAEREEGEEAKAMIRSIGR